MRLITAIKLLSISSVLLGAAPAFAARSIYHDAPAIRHEQKARLDRQSTFNIEMPNTISAGQAKANAASKTWPGDMILD
jgi:hypothetical protein